MAEALPNDIRSSTRTPTIGDEQVILSFMEGHDADTPSNAGVLNVADYRQHELHSQNSPTKRSPAIPQEYRISRSPDGALPQRVLQLQSWNDGDTTDYYTESDLEKGVMSDSELEKDGPVVTSSKVVPTLVATEVLETKEIDPNVVDWDGPDDPQNPMNWTTKRKWGVIAVLSSITFVTPLASSMFAPGVPELMQDFHNSSETIGAFVVSVYLLGFCFGPLIIAPLSELYGRMPLYHISNVLFLIFIVACAVSTDLPMFIVFRFLLGVFGCTPLTVGGGTIADIMPAEKRGGAMAIWALGPLMGPVIGPVAGGYLSAAKGWRWIYWLLAMISAVLTLFSFIFIKETYAPVIIAKKTARLRKETGNDSLRSKFDTGLSPREHFRRAIVRPTVMLCTSPIVFFMCLQTALVYGYLYLLFTTFTYVYEQEYGFSTGAAGLTFIGLGVGCFIGLFAVGIVSDRTLKAKKAANGGVVKPEFRLPPLLPAAFLMPIGLLWYGWSAEKHAHWIVPIIGSSFVGLGLLGTFMPIQMYLVDAFTVYAASALAANTVLRSLFGALLPLAGPKMYAALGLGWGNSLLAFIALALTPVPWVFLKYGERIRTSPRFQMNL